MTWFLAYPKEAPATKIKWADLLGFLIDTRTHTWRVEKLAINGFTGRRKVELLKLKDYGLLFGKHRSAADDDLGDNTFTEISPPAPPTAPLLSPSKSLTGDERHQLKKLKDHCKLYKDYYNRVIMLATDANKIATEFESQDWTAGQTMADHVDPTPLEVFGSYVAYPLAMQARAVDDVDDTVVVDIAAALNGNDPARRQWALDRLAAMSEGARQRALERLPLASAKSERLITMPTRGVFAEGKLGHCNVSEEIDNTRFWKWEEHPIPIEAPGISPVTPITPQPQQVSAIPTAFPQSLLSIVNSSPAPDPTGLAASLSLLGTPNIFRDMSGRQEVADLLKNNAVGIAEAANRAREIQAKYGVDLDKNEKDLALGQTQANAEVAQAAIQQRREEAQQVKPSEAQDAINLSASETRKGNRTPDEHKDYTSQTLANVRGASSKQTRMIRLDLEMKYPDNSRMEGRYSFKIDDLEGGTSPVNDTSHRLFTGVEYFAFRMVGPHLRIKVHGYDSILLPEQTGGLSLHYSDSFKVITIPGKGDYFVVQAVPEVTQTKVVAKTKNDARTKLTSSAKLTAKDILEISEGREVTAGVGDETTYECTVKHYTRGLIFTLVV